jgi:hypothetical protein
LSKTFYNNNLTKEELHLFLTLKNAISEKMSRNFSMSSSDITEWRGEDIVIFQEALLHQVKGQISSKWFYTHIKSTGKSLPRIDVLNMLSQFMEYENWADFKAQFKTIEEPKSEKKKIKYSVIIPVFLIIGLLPFLISKDAVYTISVIDFDTNSIPGKVIEFEHLKIGESAQKIHTDSLGRITLPVNNAVNTLILKSAYYKQDTLIRMIDDEGGEIFKVKTDDYALMVHYFSKSKVQDWKRRRRMLARIFHDDAEIFEVFKGAFGIEKYNKVEFINKLTMPLTSLKTLEVIDTEKREGKIIKMRVTQQ